MLAAILSLSIGFYLLRAQVHQQLNLDQALLIKVEKGEYANAILHKLEKQGLVKHTLGIKLWLKLNPNLAAVKAGSYELTPAMNSLDVMTLLASGKEKLFAISLVEGLRWQDWLEQLKKQPRLNTQNHAYQVIEQLQSQLPGGSLEGWLLPDTYHFADQTEISEIVKRAHSQMRSVLDELWQSRQLDLPYETPYEALIMASIIEKETGVADERPRIAGVFVNRLRLNMRLQTDPTIIYGLGPSFDGNIRRKDLTTPTPYNTYLNRGLPPTPIAMPSKLALFAALNPLDTEELYFVAKGDGSHKFSRSLKEHNQAVRQYQLAK